MAAARSLMALASGWLIAGIVYMLGARGGAGLPHRELRVCSAGAIMGGYTAVARRWAGCFERPGKDRDDEICPAA